MTTISPADPYTVSPNSKAKPSIEPKKVTPCYHDFEVAKALNFQIDFPAPKGVTPSPRTQMMGMGSWSASGMGATQFTDEEASFTESDVDSLSFSGSYSPAHGGEGGKESGTSAVLDAGGSGKKSSSSMSLTTPLSGVTFTGSGSMASNVAAKLSGEGV